MTNAVNKKIFLTVAAALLATLGVNAARTVTLTQVNRAGRTVESFDFAFGGDAGGQTYTLCMAYGAGDGGYTLEAWDHCVKLAEIGPNETSRTAVAVPEDVTGDAQWAKFFLCEEYRELDYIRSVGSSQLIDTGFTPNQTTTVAIDCQLMALTGNTGACCLFGGRKQDNDGNRKLVYWFTLNNGGIYPAINWGTADSGYLVRSETRMDGAFHVISNDCANLYLDGTCIYSRSDAAWRNFNGAYSMIMFGIRDGGNIGSRSIEARVRSLLIKNGDTVQRDYVAAVRVGGKAGLFDRAHNRMYFAGADFSTSDRGEPTGRSFLIPVANVPALPVAFGSRTVRVAQVNRVGGMDVSVDLAFEGNARGVTYVLYMASGATDAGASPRGWEHVARIAEVGPDATSLNAVPVPRADCVRFFLCSEYEQLEYISSGEGQILDTGVVPTGTMTVALDWQIVSDNLAAGEYAPVFGARNGSSEDGRWVWWMQKTEDADRNVNTFPALNWGSADSGYQKKSGAQVNHARNILKAQPDGGGVSFNVNGVRIWGAAPATLATPAPSWTLLLFGMRTDAGGGVDARSVKYGARVYGLEIDDAGTPVRDYVPAVRDGRAGLYDRVQEVFYTARAGADFGGAARGRACGTIIATAAATDAQPLVTASAATGAARPLAVEPKTYAADGALASVTVVFPEGEGVGTLALYAVYGATAGGDTIASWEHSEKVGDIPGTTTRVDYTLPTGWGTAYRYLRFIYKAEESTLPAFFDATVTPVAYLASDGSRQAIQIAHHVNFGDTFTLKWRQSVIDVRRQDEDKGFDFGQGALDVCGGGRHSLKDGFLEEVSPYIFWGHRRFSPTLYLSEISTNDVFVDTVRLTRPFVYEKKRLVDGKTWALSGRLDTPQDYVSDTDFFLFCGYNGQHGRKAIYSARIDTADGRLALNLVPVVQNGVAGFYDSVSGAFHQNRGSGAFLAGEPVDLLRGASALVCASEREVPVFGDVVRSGESVGDSFTVSGTLARTGGGTAAVTVQTSATADFATVVDWPAGEVTADGGAFTATVESVQPGTTVYWRAKAVNTTSGATVCTQWTGLPMPGATLLGPLANLDSTGLIVSPGAFDVTAGFGTTHLWLEWGATPECLDGRSTVRSYPYGSKINFAETVQMAAYGDYYYRMVASNECSTAVFVSKGEPRLRSVIDNVTYTWCGGAAGSWSEPANWTKSVAAGAGYPNSAACTVEVPSAASPVITLNGEMEVLALNVAAGGACEIRGVPGSGHALRIDDEVLMLKSNVRLTFGDCAVSCENFSAKQAGSVLTFTNAVVTTIPAANDCLAAGRGGKIVIADSQVTTQNVYFNSDGNNCEYVLQGRKTTLRVARQFRSAYGGTNGLLRIIMPDGGFDAPLIVCSSAANAISCCWFLDWGADVRYQFRLLIDPSSPGLTSDANFTQTLIDWSAGGKGIKRVNLPFETVERPSSNKLVYSDESDLPMTLSFVHERKGLVVIIR